MQIKFVGSPNFTSGRNGKPIRGFIIHWMAGNLASADSTFQNRSSNTSAHYGIEDDTIHQYVQDGDTAYQAGNWDVNLETIGIEHSAQPGRDASSKTLENSAQLISAKIREGVGNNLRKHSAIVATACPGTINVEWISNRVNELLGGAPVTKPVVIQPPLAKGTATVTVPELYVRSAPKRSAPLAGSESLLYGQSFQYSSVVQGESVQGVSTWIKSTKGNFVWAGGTDYPTTPPVASGGGTAEAVSTANVRNAPNISAPLSGSQTLNPGDQFAYSAKVHGERVSGNDIWYHSLKGNYVWSGNIKDV
jgi:hypothetical protein